MVAFRYHFFGPVFVLLTCLLPKAYAQNEQASPYSPNAQRQARDFLNEFTERRRLTNIFKNKQSLQSGFQSNYVNSSSGNLTFLIRDMVVVTPGAPMLIGRVYDSALRDAEDFGPGWKLTITERITPLGDGRWRYVNAANAACDLAEQRGKLTPVVRSSCERFDVSIDGDRVVLRSAYNERHFARDGRGYVLTRVNVVDAGSIEFQYTQRGVLQGVSASGVHVHFERDRRGRIVKARDSYGRQVSYSYDRRGRLVRATDLGGVASTYTYDAGSSQLVRMDDGRQEPVLRAEFDNRGRVVSIRHLSQAASFEYRGDQTLIADESGQSTIWHGAHGLPVALSDAAGDVTNLAYDDELRIVRLDSAARSVQFAYDGELLTEMIDGDSRLRLRYNAVGKLEGVWRDQSLIGRYKYDANGHLVGATDAAGQRAYGYDHAGMLASFAIGDRTAHVRTARNGLVQSLQANDRRLAFTYASTGALEQITYGDNEVSARYAHDARGLRDRATYSYGAATTFNYDTVGNVVGIEHLLPDGRRVNKRFEIGRDNQVLSVTDGNTTLALGYDDVGRLTVAQQDGREAAIAYDWLGRVAEVTLDGLPVFARDYTRSEVNDISAFDRRTKELIVDRSPFFVDTATALCSRWQQTDNGPIYFSDDLKVIEVSLAALAPDAVLFDTLERRQLTLAPEDLRALPLDFDKPSNALFIPPEYRSVNCDICIFNIVGAILKVNGSTATAHVQPGENVHFDAEVSSVLCMWHHYVGFPAGYLYHPGLLTSDTSFGDGSSHGEWISQFSPNISFNHTYSQPGTYPVLEEKRCNCGSLFALALAAAEVQVQPSCSDTQRKNFHAADFVNNSNFAISNPGTTITAHFLVKSLSPTNVPYSAFVSGAQQWNGIRTHGAAVWNVLFTFEQVVGSLSFPPGRIDTEVEFHPPTDPELGRAERGGTRIWLTPEFPPAVAAHEFGHILGFRDAYTIGPPAADVSCHETDIMSSYKPTTPTSVQGFHAQVLAELY